MYTVLVVGTISVALLIAVVRACVWFQRWDPLDFLDEAAYHGQFNSHRSANSLRVDPADENYSLEPPVKENESQDLLLLKC
jgi:hypothetical protein